MTVTINRTTNAPKRVLMVVANPATSTTTGWPVGFWASELFHPLYEFTDAGHEVTVASPDGGPVEFDALSDPRDSSGYSADDVLGLGYLSSDQHPARLTDTPRLSEPDLDDYPLHERGANDIQGGLWKAFAVRDGRLITGQQQYSGRKVAALVIEALGT